MISSIRRRFTGAAYRSLLWFIVFAFIAGLIVLPGALRFARTGGPWVIRINDEDIGFADFAHEVQEKQRWLGALNAQYGDYASLLLKSMGIEPNPRKLAFDQLTRAELIHQFSSALGIHMHPEFIGNQLSNPYVVLQDLAELIPQQVVNFQTGEIDTALLKRVLQQKGMSVDEFEYKLSRLLANKLAMEIVGSSFYVPEFEKNQIVQNEFATKTFEVLKIPFGVALRAVKQQPVTDAELKAFYDQQNQAVRRYWVPEKRSGLVWKFDPKTYDIVVSPEQINQYYDAQKAKLFIEKPVTVQVRRILISVTNEVPREQAITKMKLIQEELAKDPTRFAELAKEYSADEVSASNGGLLKPFARGEMEQAFERAAFLLSEDGEVSNVFQTKDGFEIVQRVSKQKPVYKPIASVTQEISKTLTQKLFKEQFVKDMKRIIELPISEREVALQELIKKKGGKPQAIDGMALDDSPEAKALFKLEQDGISFFVEDEHGVAIKLTGIKKAYLPELNAIKSTVENDLYNSRAQEELKKYAASGRATAKEQSFANLQKRLHGTLEKVGPLKATDSDQIDALAKQGIPITQMLQLEKKEGVLSEITPEGAYLVKLVSIQPAVEGLSQEKIKEKGGQILNDRMRLFMEGFIASLYRNATIETNESILH